MADASLVRDSQRLQAHFDYLFRMAQQSVDQELKRRRKEPGDPPGGEARATDNPADRPATARQNRAICGLASRLEFDLARSYWSDSARNASTTFRYCKPAS